MLDYNIDTILKNAPLARMRIIDRYIKNLSLYGKQDPVLGVYLDMLLTTLSMVGLGDNFRLELYKKTTALLRDNSILKLTPATPRNPAGTGLAFYYGSGPLNMTPEELQSLLSRDISFKENKSYKFSPTLERFIFAYPTVYNLLDSIEDQNGFNTLDGWGVRTADFTIDGELVSYYVMEFNHITTQLDFVNTFIF